MYKYNTLKSDCKTKLSFHLIVRFKDHDVLFDNNKTVKLILLNIIEEIKKNISTRKDLRILGLSLEEQKKMFFNDNNNLKCVITYISLF